ncbi:MAG: tRNA threonylcarbamoyladenosine dehydratase [Candidatus Omnitrophota bacterium]
MMKQFLRTELLLGKDRVRTLHHRKVAVIGLGAVGSYAVEALARAGVGNFFLVDCDVIEESNINRQLYALHSTVGQDKVQVARERVLDINPKCRVKVERIFMHHYSIGAVFAFEPDLIVDAVDSLNAKVSILAEIHRRGVPVISSMGAALRKDPSKIKFGDISHTWGCPLAKSVRKRLRRLGIREGISCVYSTEEVPALAEAEGGEETIESVEKPGENFQGRPRRPLGSLPTVCGIFGLTVAHYAVELLIKEKI